MFLECKAVNGGLNGLLIGDCDRLHNKLRKAVPNLDLYSTVLSEKHPNSHAVIDFPAVYARQTVWK